MRIFLVIAAIYLLLCLPGNLRAAPTTQPLQEIASPEELSPLAAGMMSKQSSTQPAKQTRITLPTGEKVRLAIGPLDAELGPWRIVYCVLEEDGTANKSEHPEVGDGESLGPLWVRCDVKDSGSETKVEKRDRVEWGEMGIKKVLPITYQALVPIKPGPAVIRVATSAKKVVAEIAVDGPKDLVTPWRPFSRDNFQRTPAGERFGPALIVSEHNAPVIPYLAQVFDPAKKSKKVPDANPAPLAELKLSLKDGLFTVDAGPMKIQDDDSLLARWWVNGKLQLPDPKARQFLFEKARMVREESVLNVGFALPNDLKNCAVADHIAVQVLYSKGGWKYFPSDRRSPSLAMRADEFSPDLAISNRLEFTLTAEQLKPANP